MSGPRALVPDLPRDAWVILGGDALSGVGSGLTLPFLLVYLSQVRGIDVELAGLAVATIALAAIIGNPLSGSLTDRLGARNTLVLGLLVQAGGTVLVTLVREAWHGFAAAGVMGFGAAVVWPAQDALLATVVRAKQRSNVFAVRHATVNAGFGLGGLIAAAIVDVSSPGTFVLIYLLDALSFLAFVPILLTVRVGAGKTEAAGEPFRKHGYREVLRDRIFLRVWILTALLVTVGYAQLHSGFPGYATGPGRISAGALSLAFVANTFTVVVAQLVVLRLLAGRRRTRAVMLVCGAWAAAWTITLIAGGLGGGSGAVSLFALAMMVFALGETMLSPTMPAIVNDLAPEALRGRYNGLYTLAWTAGFMAGPAIAGFALAAGLGPALFLGLIFACGIAAVGAGRLERHLPDAANRIGELRLPEPVAAAPLKCQFAPSSEPS